VAVPGVTTSDYAFTTETYAGVYKARASIPEDGVVRLHFTKFYAGDSYTFSYVVISYGG
jgi:hypothetical protein